MHGAEDFSVLTPRSCDGWINGMAGASLFLIGRRQRRVIFLLTALVYMIQNQRSTGVESMDLWQTFVSSMGAAQPVRSCTISCMSRAEVEHQALRCVLQHEKEWSEGPIVDSACNGNVVGLSPHEGPPFC